MHYQAAAANTSNNKKSISRKGYFEDQIDQLSAKVYLFLVLRNIDQYKFGSLMVSYMFKTFKVLTKKEHVPMKNTTPCFIQKWYTGTLDSLLLPVQSSVYKPQLQILTSLSKNGGANVIVRRLPRPKVDIILQILTSDEIMLLR